MNEEFGISKGKNTRKRLVIPGDMADGFGGLGKNGEKTKKKRNQGRDSCVGDRARKKPFGRNSRRLGQFVLEDCEKKGGDVSIIKLRMGGNILKKV